MHTALSVWGATWWDAAQAVGTLAAVAIAVGVALVETSRARNANRARDQLLLDQASTERIKTSLLVSAWIETEYMPSRDGSHYDRQAQLFVANESNDPVFEVHVVVGVGDPPIQVGPLAVPVEIPVLPPRRTRSWDVSMGLFAFDPSEGLIPAHPVARIDFTDSHGVTWHRDFNGKLIVQDSPETYSNEAEPPGELQLGDLDNLYNPQAVVLLFVHLLDDVENNLEELKELLDENAPGWGDFDYDTAITVQETLEEYELATHVWYPAPYVSYVRLVHKDVRLPNSTGTPVKVPVRVLTLTFAPDRGWRIFSAGGATAPDWIRFPPSTLHRAPRD